MRYRISFFHRRSGAAEALSQALVGHDEISGGSVISKDSCMGTATIDPAAADI